MTALINFTYQRRYALLPNHFHKVFWHMGAKLRFGNFCTEEHQFSLGVGVRNFTFDTLILT